MNVYAIKQIIQTKDKDPNLSYYKPRIGDD